MTSTDLNKTIQFLDGSRLEISTVEGTDAANAFLTHLQPIIAQIETELTNQQPACCQALLAVLDDQSRYPVLTYISPARWQAGHLSGEYHGAEGDGFYEIYRLEGTDQVTYVHLKTCPFCQAKVTPLPEDGDIYEDDLSPGDL